VSSINATHPGTSQFLLTRSNIARIIAFKFAHRSSTGTRTLPRLYKTVVTLPTLYTATPTVPLE
jgi:hypothetical protein